MLKIVQQAIKSELASAVCIQFMSREFGLTCAYLHVVSADRACRNVYLPASSLVHMHRIELVVLQFNIARSQP